MIISYSGNSVSQNPVNRIGILKKNHVPIIGITRGGDNYMRKNLDFKIKNSRRLEQERITMMNAMKEMNDSE